MPNVVLFVVDEPDPEEALLESGAATPHPLMASTGDVNHLCGECGFVLLENLHAGQVTGFGLFRCPRCGKVNATRT